MVVTISLKISWKTGKVNNWLASCLLDYFFQIFSQELGFVVNIVLNQSFDSIIAVPILNFSFRTHTRKFNRQLHEQEINIQVFGTRLIFIVSMTNINVCDMKWSRFSLRFKNCLTLLTIVTHQICIKRPFTSSYSFNHKICIKIVDWTFVIKRNDSLIYSLYNKRHEVN